MEIKVGDVFRLKDSRGWFSNTYVIVTDIAKLNLLDFNSKHIVYLLKYYYYSRENKFLVEDLSLFSQKVKFGQIVKIPEMRNCCGVISNLGIEEK